MPWDRTPDLGTAGGAAGPAPCRPRLCEPRPQAPRSTSLEGLAHARGGGQGLAQTRSPKGRKRRRRSSVCRTVFYDEGPGPRRGWGRRVSPREIKTSHGVANRTQSRGGKEGEAEGGQGAGRPRPRATPRVLLTLSDSAGRRGAAGGGRRRTRVGTAGRGVRPREGGAEPGARGGPGPDQGAPWQRTGRRPAVGAGLADGAVLPGGAPSRTGRAVALHPSRRPGWKGHPENWTETWAGKERREDGGAGTRPGPAAAPRAAPPSAGAERGERVRSAPRSLADARRRRGIQSSGARRARR